MQFAFVLRIDAEAEARRRDVAKHSGHASEHLIPRVSGESLDRHRNRLIRIEPEAVLAAPIEQAGELYRQLGEKLTPVEELESVQPAGVALLDATNACLDAS